MLSSIASTVSTNPYISYPLIAVGAIAILSKVCKVAIPIIKRVASVIYNSTPAIRLRSLFCKECSARHRIHINFPTKMGESINLCPVNLDKHPEIPED